MEINKVTNGKSTTISLVGRLDTLTAPELEQALTDVISNQEEIIFDFSKLEYLSSAGLRVLLNTQKTINAKKGKMIIRHVNDIIMDVFDMTGFSSILTIED